MRNGKIAWIKGFDADGAVICGLDQFDSGEEVTLNKSDVRLMDDVSLDYLGYGYIDIQEKTMHIEIPDNFEEKNFKNN